jgi:hypothetical protein
MHLRLFHIALTTARLQRTILSGLSLFLAAMLWILPSSCLEAQERDSTTKEKTFVPLGSMMQTPTTATRKTQGEMTKSPVLALALSLIPGLGQIYVESYWKAPIFLGGFGTAVGFLIYNTAQLSEANRLLGALVDATSPLGTRQFLTRRREIFRDYRDISIVSMIGVIGLAAIDAYVGAHLFDFDVSDELKATLRFDPLQQRINLTLRLQESEQPRPPNDDATTPPAPNTNDE